MNSNILTVSNLIKSKRDERKWSQARLAKELKTSKTLISNWEKGKVAPKGRSLSKLSEIFEYDFEGVAEEESKVVSLYYPEVAATAGFDKMLFNNNHNVLRIEIPNVQADAFINVFGDSMHPKFRSGMIIGIKQVDKDMISYGNAYVVLMVNGEAYIKYIKRGKDEHHWLFVSENAHFEPQEFHHNKIAKVYAIKAVITRESLL